MNTIPPLTSSAIEQLRTLIESATAVKAPTREWDISLACGHAILYQQHASLHAPDSPTWRCNDCGVRRRVIGSAPVNDVRKQAWHFRETQVEFRRALNEVARLRRQLARAERRAATARTSLHGVQDDIEPFGRASAARGEIDAMDELPEYRPA